MRHVPAHLINIVKSDHMQRRAPSDARELLRAMQVVDDATIGSAPARALTLTPVLLVDEGRDFVRVAEYKLVRAGHASSLSPAGIWTPDTGVVLLKIKLYWVALALAVYGIIRAIGWVKMTLQTHSGRVNAKCLKVMKRL